MAPENEKNAPETEKTDTETGTDGMKKESKKPRVKIQYNIDYYNYNL